VLKCVIILHTREAWANLLRNYIESKTDHYIEVYDLGIDGNTTKDLLRRFDVEAEARKPELIIFAIGVNDSMFRNENIYDIDSIQFAKNLNTINDKAKEFTDKIWFVGLAKGSDSETNPLKRSSTGKCYSKESVEKYDGVIKEFAIQKALPFVDIYKSLSDFDFDDGLHPNIEGHKKIFESFKKLVDAGGVV
jgi:lysophospholipase L1-like esterase